MKTEDRFNSLINQRIYAWLVTDTPLVVRKKAYYLTCICECGKTKLVSLHSLIKGGSKSCGCKKQVNIQGIVDWKKKNGPSNIKPAGVAAFNRLYNGYRCSARNKGIEFTLTKDQFKALTVQNCHYCGKTPSSIAGGEHINGTYTYNGIDRKNNSSGYILENCLTCCKDCNFLKKDRNYNDFLELIKRISEHLNEKKS